MRGRTAGVAPAATVQKPADRVFGEVSGDSPVLGGK